MLEKDLQRVVETTRTQGKMLGAFNTIFMALIPKEYNLTTFEKFGPISLCKIISKVVARRLKIVLSNQISRKQFGFLEGRQIHEAIRVAQECIHFIKVKNQRSMVMKVDLSKACDMLIWLCIRLILIHLGFCHQFVVWIMSFISSISFLVLLNGAATPFFKSGKGLR
jgi:hypothetical protein